MDGPLKGPEDAPPYARRHTKGHSSIKLGDPLPFAYTEGSRYQNQPYAGFVSTWSPVLTYYFKNNQKTQDTMTTIEGYPIRRLAKSGPLMRPRASEVPVSRSTRQGLPSLTISDLNDDCFLSILKYFPLQAIVGLRAVNHTWKGFIDRQILAKKRSIKVFGTPEDIYRYLDLLGKTNLRDHPDMTLKPIGAGDDDLLLSRFELLPEVLSLFPGLLRLTVAIYKPDSWHCLAEALLTELPALEALTLCGLHSGRPPTFAFWMMLNMMPRLSEFTLLDAGWMSGILSIHKERMEMPVDLYFLDRLTSFTLFDYPAHIGAHLQMLGRRVSELRLDYVRITPPHFELSLQANPGLMASLTHLTLGTVQPFDSEIGRESVLVPLLEVVARRLKNLTHLTILYTDYTTPFTEVLRPLTGLPKLTHLHTPVHWGCKESRVPEPATYPRLSTVRHLSITASNSVSAVAFMATFPAIFACITSLTVEALDDAFYLDLQLANPFRLFPTLSAYTPIYPIHSRLAGACPLRYRHAGRHSAAYRAYTEHAYPLIVDFSEADSEELARRVFFGEH